MHAGLFRCKPVQSGGESQLRSRSMLRLLGSEMWQIEEFTKTLTSLGILQFLPFLRSKLRMMTLMRGQCWAEHGLWMDLKFLDGFLAVADVGWIPGYLDNFDK